MDIDNEKKYCQSCGMPLDIEGISEYGTNSDGTLNQEFCSCCLNSGKYLFDFSMEYLIYLWGLFPDSYNQIAGTNYKSEELRNVLSDRLPNLKRWKQKINTAHIHYALIINVQEYINRHLFEDLNSDNLSHIAWNILLSNLFQQIQGYRNCSNRQIFTTNILYQGHLKSIFKCLSLLSGKHIQVLLVKTKL